jgi:hypothetical protein
MKKKETMKSIAIICAVFLTMFMFSCGGGGVASDSGTTKVTVNIGQSKLTSLSNGSAGRSSSAIPSNVSSVSVTVSGSGMDTQQQTVNVSGQSQVSLTFNAVPNGLNRDFFAVAMDENGKTVFQGDAKADLDGTPKDITIDMNFFIAGAWSIFKTPQGGVEQGPGFITFTQTGNTINIPSIVQTDGGTGTGSGTISGDSVQFNVSGINNCGESVTINLTGTVSANGNEMSGNYTIPGTGECGETGAWRAERALPPAFDISGDWSVFVTPQGGTELPAQCITITQTGNFFTLVGPDGPGFGIVSGNIVQLILINTKDPSCTKLTSATSILAPDGNSMSNGTSTTVSTCGVPPPELGTWSAVKGACTAPPQQQGTLSGTVTDQLGQPLAGVDVSLSQQGSTIASTTTDSNGQYSLNAPAGSGYTAAFSKSGYITATFNNVSIAANATTTLNASLSPVLAAGQVRIILTWGPNPSDLDSHLTGPISGSSLRFHIYYADSCFPEGTCTFDDNGNNIPGPDTLALLDHDTTDHSATNPVLSPETTTIVQQIDGTYIFYVHDYSNGGDPTSTALSNSGATVQVYLGNSLAATYNVPTNQAGTVWTVFELNGTTLGQVNTISGDESVIQSARNSSSLKKKASKR